MKSLINKILKATDIKSTYAELIIKIRTYKPLNKLLSKIMGHEITDAENLNKKSAESEDEKKRAGNFADSNLSEDDSSWFI